MAGPEDADLVGGEEIVAGKGALEMRRKMGWEAVDGSEEAKKPLCLNLNREGKWSLERSSQADERFAGGGGAHRRRNGWLEVVEGHHTQPHYHPPQARCRNPRSRCLSYLGEVDCNDSFLEKESISKQVYIRPIKEQCGLIAAIGQVASREPMEMSL